MNPLDIEYDENTVLTYGRFKYVPIKRVNPEYLIRIYENGNRHDPALFAYIEKNIYEIRAKAYRNQLERPPELKCKKTVFVSEKEAKARIRDIKAESGREKVPVPAYECPECGFWHLTSLPSEKQLKFEQ